MSIKPKDAELAKKIEIAVVNYALDHKADRMLISDLCKQVGSSAAKVNELLNEMCDDIDLCDKEVSWFDKSKWQERQRLAPAVMPSRRKLVKVALELMWKAA